MKDGLLLKSRLRLLNDLSYSVRRYFVDVFYIKYFSDSCGEDALLDMGGLKNARRGVFHISDFISNAKFANIDAMREPDYLCDIASVPEKDSSFKTIILSEVLEHISEPKIVLEEAYRLLRAGGKILITVPFMFHKHADPEDYCRYTDSWLENALSQAGFKNIEIIPHGGFFAVLANMIKLCANELAKSGKPRPFFIRWIFHRFVKSLVRKSIKWDNKSFFKKNKMFSGHTTGYGIIAEK